MQQTALKTICFTALALLAFAANSILCRLALHVYHMDAANFTAIRLFSGALLLFLIIQFRQQQSAPPLAWSKLKHWYAPCVLFIYASSFSFAYIRLDTATGALILFASVQITMLVYARLTAQHINNKEYLGVLIACVGFVYLIYPNIHSPSAIGFLLMSISGIAWAIYTIQGKQSQQPLNDTAHHFIKTVPFIALLILLNLPHSNLNIHGIALAIASGSIASALGYAIWYRALTGLKHTQAAVVQLFVPVIAALGGMVFVSESMTLRFLIASFVILSGIFLVVFNQHSTLKK